MKPSRFWSNTAPAFAERSGTRMSANATAKRPFERGLANTQRVESVAVATNNAAMARPGRSLQNKHAKNAADATIP